MGYTTTHLHCPFPDLPPIVGYARTAEIRATAKSSSSSAADKQMKLDYYEYVGTGPGPRISVIQDLDGAQAGFGAFWGEVNSAIHKALGSLGVVTDGSIRDIPNGRPVPGPRRCHRPVARPCSPRRVCT